MPLPFPVTLFSGTSFLPISLFSNGEQGVWFQNSDMSTLFRDAAGTTPVDGYEQFVGLRLDKSKSGVGTNGGRRLNLLAWTDQFDNAYWAKSSVLITSNQAIAPDGTMTADLMYPAGSGNFRSVYNSNSLVGGRVLKVRAKAAGLSWLWFINGPGNTVAAWFNLSTGVKGSVIAGYTHDMQPLGDGWYECTMTSASADIIFAQFGVSDADNSSTVTVSGTNGVYLWGADMRTVANSTIEPLYQRITADWLATIPGNHAFQSNINARAVLSARYNLLTYTEQFDGGTWAKGGATVAAGFTDALGTARAWKLQETTGTSEHFISISPSGVSTTTNRWSIDVKSGERNYALLFGSGIGGAYFNLTDGSSVNYSSPPDSKGSIPLGGGWWRIWIEKNGTPANCQLYVSDTGSRFNYPGTAGSGIYFTFADLRVANESSALPAYQRVGAAVNGTSTVIGTPDYDTVGFPPYLRYDGGDWYQTNSINFSQGATNPPLGPELVANGDFSNGTTGWTERLSTLAVVSGQLEVTSTSAGNSYAGAIQTITTASNQWYKVSIVIGSGTSDVNNMYLNVDGVIPGNSGIAQFKLSVGANTFFFRAVNATTYFNLLFYCTASGQTRRIGGVSVASVTDTNYIPDKMSVFAGVRKLTDDLDMLFELGQDWTVAGSFGAYVNPGAPNGYTVGVSGTADNLRSYSNLPAPRTDIITLSLTTLAANSDAAISTRFNANFAYGVSAGSANSTGTFGNYPLNIGARNGVELQFTGREYGLVIVGRGLTAAELSGGENWFEGQTFGKDMNYFYADELTTATGDLITAADGDQIYMTSTYS